MALDKSIPIKDIFYNGEKMPFLSSGEVTLPATLHDTLTVELGFTPRAVLVTLYDDEYSMQTYTIGYRYGSNYRNKTACFFQDDGYYKSYTLTGSTENAGGHIIDITDTGFILQTGMPYFASRQLRWVAL